MPAIERRILLFQALQQNIVREQAVRGVYDLFFRQGGRGVEAESLRKGMDAGIGSSGSVDFDVFPANLAQNLFNNPLN